MWFIITFIFIIFVWKIFHIFSNFYYKGKGGKYFFENMNTFKK